MFKNGYPNYEYALFVSFLSWKQIERLLFVMTLWVLNMAFMFLNVIWY
jgi:hypothetical protein